MGPHFHYNCVRVLAGKSGFAPAEADVIAYASQYTDHATEHKPIRVEGMPAEAVPQAIDDTFNPICTAHETLQYVTKWRSKDAQRKVYLSFHFVPPKPYTPGGPFQFLVSPDSDIAKQLVADAAAAIPICQEGSSERLRNMIRLGIALHSYADTWAHQDFSGRWSPTDNDVQDRQVWEKDSWTSVPLLMRAGLDLAPDVGHAEMANLVDQSDAKLRFMKASNGKQIERDNAIEFMKAAKAIYELMLSATAHPNAWNEFSADLAACFRDPFLWDVHFGDELTQRYDRVKWRKEALDGLHHDWDRYDEEGQFAALHYHATGDLKWFFFHVEAGKQREFVLKQVGDAQL